MLLHDLHSDYPLGPDNWFNNKKWPKLIATLSNKKKYIVYYSTLKLYLSFGLKLENISILR